MEKPGCWEILKLGGEGDDRGWDGWMASPTWWTWVWASSRSWWWTEKPGMLWSMGLQRVRHYWATELNWLIWTGVRWYLIVVLMCISLIITSYILNSNYSSTIYYRYCLFSFAGSWFPGWLYMFGFISELSILFHWSIEMATHSSTLAWKIPWKDSGKLQSMGSQRVRHDWVTSLHIILFWWL